MTTSLLYLTTLTVLSLVFMCKAQSPEFRPRDPVIPFTDCNTRRKGQVVRFISDKRTKCHYWECNRIFRRAQARICGLGTHVSEFYEAGNTNPCLIQHNQTFGFLNPIDGSGGQFDCTRKGFDPNGVPVCIRTYVDNDVCRNNGTVVAEGSLCWCMCAADFTGYSCTSRLRDDDNQRPETSPTTAVRATAPPEVIIEAAEERHSSELLLLDDDPRRAQRQERKRQRQERKERKKLRRENKQSQPPGDNAVTSEVPDTPAPQLVNQTPTTSVAPRVVNVGNGVTVLAPYHPPASGPVASTVLPNDPNDPTNPNNPNAPRPPSAPREPQVPAFAMVEDGEVFIPQEIIVLPQEAATVDETGMFVFTDPCPNGVPNVDFCAETGGCFNEGKCVNECLGLQCLCKSPFTAGRRCEKFRCQKDIECMNGGTCMRGRLGNDPVAVCECNPGFTGGMCEINVDL